ncbi:ComEC/Rec2 family competence protein [Candidatus Shapirobacteria bacterium]|nr:ComEC/Rec2 family competence protein [Candidatus Shapirobacteria bacterium]
MKRFFSYLFFLFALGSLWFYRWQKTTSFPREELIGQEVKIEGVLKKEPQSFSQTQTFSLEGLKVKTAREPVLHYGDRVEIVGKVEQSLTKDGKKELWLNYPSVNLLNPSAARGFGRTIFSLRQKVVLFFESLLPEPTASLVSGVLLGVKSTLPSDFYQNLVKTGMLHVVVASGTNVVLVSSFVLPLLNRFFNRRRALLLTLPAIWFYVFLCGAEPPLLRAAIMASFSIGGTFFGRQKESWRGLALAGVLLALFDPGMIFDLGFQLSFASSAGIIFFKNRLGNFFSWLPTFGSFKDDLLTTLAAQIFTTPLLLISFGQFSPFSFLANATLLWLISPIMLLGMILIIIGPFLPFLAQPFSWLVFLPSKIFVEGVSFWGHILPFFSFSLPWWLLIGYFGFWATVIFKRPKIWY